METLLLDPMSQLLALLADPDPLAWEKLAVATCLHSIQGKPNKRATFLQGVDVASQNSSFELHLNSTSNGIDPQAWNLFLSMSNLFYLHPTRALVSTDRVEAPIEEPSPVESKVGGFSPDWQEIIDDYEGDDDALPALEALASAGVYAPDSAGDEISSVMTIATWSSVKLALLYPGDALEDSSWTVIDSSTVIDGTIPADFDTVRETS